MPIGPGGVKVARPRLALGREAINGHRFEAVTTATKSNAIICREDARSAVADALAAALQERGVDTSNSRFLADVGVAIFPSGFDRWGGRNEQHRSSFMHPRCRRPTHVHHRKVSRRLIDRPSTTHASSPPRASRRAKLLTTGTVGTGFSGAARRTQPG